MGNCIMEELENEDFFDDDDPFEINEIPPSDPETTKVQETLTLDPQYEIQSGVKFEFTGTLLIPAPGEAERLMREKQPEVSSVCIANPVVYGMTKDIRAHRFAKNKNDFRKVKMNGLEALRFRAKGQ